MLVMQSKPFAGLPDVMGRGLWALTNLGRHYAVRTIRQYYPEYIPRARDMDARCNRCAHHINAHANGKGGICTVITDSPAYQATRAANEGLCNCPAFAA